MSDNRISWESYFMMQALIISRRSTCQRAYVGAVLTKNNRVLSSGYNGSVSGDDHCIDAGHKMREGHCIRTVHSEVNAITQCARYGIPTDGTTIYVTHFPCLNCTKTLIQSGVTSIKYLFDYNNDEYAKSLLDQSNVSYDKVEIDKDTFTLSFNELRRELDD